MIWTHSLDVDNHLTPETLRSWIRTEWVKKPVTTSSPVKVSGYIPVSKEIMDDMKYLTHDEHVELVQPLNPDQVALVLYRVANMLDSQSATIGAYHERERRMRRTARSMLGLRKKKTAAWEVAELLGIPTED